MASYYVWSGATGIANGSSWANAFITLIGRVLRQGRGRYVLRRT